MINLQRRDRDILACCHDQQFLLHSHVERFFFKGAGERRARERVHELERAGFIRQERSVHFGRLKIIRLTKEGLALIEADRGVQVDPVARLNVATLQHDALVTSVRLRLQEIWDARWVPERLLKVADFGEIPDGVLIFHSGAQVMVEVENSRKDEPRFHKLLERWRRVDPLLALYVATEAKLHAMLKRWILDGPRDLPVGLLFWEELRDGSPKVWTVRGELPLLERKVIG